MSEEQKVGVTLNENSADSKSDEPEEKQDEFWPNE